jgi:uncharacterized membrane protein YhaH (DUF805 family)
MISTFTWYFLSLKGRLTRQEFWLGAIGSFAVMVVLIRTLPNLVLYNQAGRLWYRDELEHALRWPTLTAVVIMFWPFIVIFAKRLHDLNLSGWWLLAIPAIAPVARMVHFPPSALFLLAVAVIGLIPGTLGNNRFGLDPHAHSGI